MTDSLALIIDTNSNYSDVWSPCFNRLNKHAPDIKKYVFTDTASGVVDVPDNIIPIIYDNSENYRNQFLSCIKQVKEEYIIYTSEDYILFDDVNLKEIQNICNVLRDNEYSFCKLIKGPEKVTQFKDNLFIIDQNDKNFFAQQASVWNTRDFEKVFETSPHQTRMQHEPGGSRVCKKLGLKGMQYYAGNKRRGLTHYDSTIYPCIATAVVKGKWNISEYPTEMAEVFREFNIDIFQRGHR